MSKKVFQIVGVILILSVLLTACQSAQTPPPTVAQAPTQAAAVPTQAVAAPTQAAAAPKVGGQLNYLGWEGYDDMAAFKPLYDQTGLVLNTTYIGTNDEVITKLKAGGLGTYDVGDINARYLHLMATTGMLMPLDESRLPNLKDLFPAFKEQNYGYVDGKLYAVPAFFGNTSICYRADKVSEPTWDFFTKPEYQGKYAVSSNGLSDTYLWAMALGLGQDATKWTQADLAKIKARGMEEFKHAATMITGGGGEMTDLLVRGDVVLVTDCWDQVAVNAQKQGVDVKSVTPAGPIKATLDIYFIFAGAKNVDAAYAWLNQAISAEAMAIMAKDYGSAVTNVKAFDLLEAAFKQSLHFDTLNDTIKRTEFNVMPNPDAKPPYVTLDDITKAFEEVKATAGEAPAAPAATQEAVAPKVGGQLNYLGWEGYDDMAAFKPLYDQTGMVLNTTYIGTNDEVITKLKAGGLGTYDVGDINARYLHLMASTGMLMPLDESRLPNLKDLFPAFKEQNYGVIDGKLYAVPAFFGNTSICYRADKVSEPTWDFFTKPEYQGKYAVSSNGLSDTYLWAMALGLGQDATKWTQDDLAKIKARGMEEFKHAATMITGGGGEMTDLLVRGDVVLVTDCWDQVAVNAQKQGVDVKSVTPAGPIKATLDIYFIFAGAKNVDAAYAWLNQAISAEAMAIMAKDYGSAVTNVKAFDLLEAAFKQSLHFDTLNDTIKRTEFNVMPNPDAKPPYVTLDDITKAFEEIKATVK